MTQSARLDKWRIQLSVDSNGNITGDRTSTISVHRVDKGVFCGKIDSVGIFVQDADYPSKASWKDMHACNINEHVPFEVISANDVVLACGGGALWAGKTHQVERKVSMTFEHGWDGKRDIIELGRVFIDVSCPTKPPPAPKR
jgi:hypothetical protein